MGYLIDMLQKLATNRMTKELEKGTFNPIKSEKEKYKHLKQRENDLNSIMDTHTADMNRAADKNRKLSLNERINRRAGILDKSIIRSEDQMARGINRGNEILAEKAGYKIDYAHDMTTARTVPHLSPEMQAEMDALAPILGKNKSGTIYYNSKSGKLLDAYIGRHEVFEAQGMGTKPLASMKDSSTHAFSKGIQPVGRHHSPAVLAKENNVYARMWHKKALKDITNFREASHEVKVPEHVGKTWGRKLSKKEIAKIKNVKRSKFLNFQWHQLRRGFKDGINWNKAIPAGATGAAIIGGLGYLAYKRHKNANKRK